MQASDAHTQLTHEGHVVLDHDHRLVLVDLFEQFCGLMRFHIRHARHRLIHQKQFGILRQQHTDLEPLLLAVRQRAGQTIARILEPDRLQHALDAFALVGRFAPEQRAAYAMIDVERQQQIVLDGLAFEHRRLLEFASDAEFGDLCFVEPRQIDRAVEQHVALVRLGLAGDDVHHRGLAGAVRADDGAHLARRNGQRQIVNGVEAVERDMHAVEIEHGGCGAGVHDVHVPTPPNLV